MFSPRRKSRHDVLLEQAFVDAKGKLVNISQEVVTPPCAYVVHPMCAVRIAWRGLEGGLLPQSYSITGIAKSCPEELEKGRKATVPARGAPWKWQSCGNADENFA